MHTALLDRTVEELRAVRKHLDFSGRVRTLSGGPFSECASDGKKCPNLVELFSEAPGATYWRIIDHCTAVMRTYALFEGFILQVLREYISFLEKSYKFTELGADFVAKYTRGIGQILLDQDKSRHAKIDVPALLAEATAALSDRRPYQIRPEALLRPEQNLRMSELQRLFAHCGLPGIEGWISGHSAVRSFFAAQSRLSDTVDSELKQIVDYRNEAAHGDVDQVLGMDTLIEVTEFFEALLTSVTDFVQHERLTREKILGRAQIVGVISERFHDDIVVAKITNASVTVGDKLYVYGRRMTAVAQIKSIQVDNVAHDMVDVTTEQEVGLRLGVRCSVGCQLIRVT
jgi:hypothetical protein